MPETKTRLTDAFNNSNQTFRNSLSTLISSINLYNSSGYYLDRIAAKFGLKRTPRESDFALRTRIWNSCYTYLARGSLPGVRQEVAEITKIGPLLDKQWLSRDVLILGVCEIYPDEANFFNGQLIIDYTAPEEREMDIEITHPGAIGTAEYQYRIYLKGQTPPAWTTDILTSIDWTNLSDGVRVKWVAGTVNFNVGDKWYVELIYHSYLGIVDEGTHLLGHIQSTAHFWTVDEDYKTDAEKQFEEVRPAHLQVEPIWVTKYISEKVAIRGTITSFSTSDTIVDTNANLTNGAHVNKILRIATGTAIGSSYTITGNTSTTITCGGANFPGDGVEINDSYVIENGTYNSTELSLITEPELCTLSVPTTDYRTFAFYVWNLGTNYLNYEWFVDWLAHQKFYDVDLSYSKKQISSIEYYVERRLGDSGNVNDGTWTSWYKCQIDDRITPQIIKSIANTFNGNLIVKYSQSTNRIMDIEITTDGPIGTAEYMYRIYLEGSSPGAWVFGRTTSSSWDDLPHGISIRWEAGTNDFAVDDWWSVKLSNYNSNQRYIQCRFHVRGNDITAFGFNRMTVKGR